MSVPKPWWRHTVTLETHILLTTHQPPKYPKSLELRIDSDINGSKCQPGNHSLCVKETHHCANQPSHSKTHEKGAGQLPSLATCSSRWSAWIHQSVEGYNLKYPTTTSNSKQAMCTSRSKWPLRAAVTVIVLPAVLLSAKLHLPLSSQICSMPTAIVDLDLCATQTIQ